MNLNNSNNSNNSKYLNDYAEKLHNERLTSDEKVVWTQFAPGNSGYSESVFVHPTDDQTIFNFPDMFNSYRSTNGGVRFETVLDSDGVFSDPDGIFKISSQIQRVYSVDFSRQNPDFGMATNRDGIWITNNKGARWSLLQYDKSTPHKADNYGEKSISAIAVDPTDENIWYAGCGIFWDVKGNNRTDKYIHGIRSRQYSKLGNLWKSVDKGITWEIMQNTGIHPLAEFGKIFINPLDTNMIIIVTSYGLYKSTDAKSWRKIETIENKSGDDFNLVRDMAVYFDKESKDFTFYIINQIKYLRDDENKTIKSVGGIYKSTDFCESFENITGDLGIDVKSLHEQTLKDTGTDVIKEFYYANNRAIGKYFHGEVTEENYPNLPTHLLNNYNRIVVDPTNPQRIFVSHNAMHDSSMYVGDLWKTEDGGKSWIIATRSGECWDLSKDYWNKKNPNQSTKRNVSYNHEGFRFTSEPYATGGIRDLDIDSQGNLYIMYRSLVKSTDHGETFNQIDADKTPNGNWVGTGGSNLPGTYIVTDKRDDDLMYFLTDENYLFKVTNDGSTIGSLPAVKSLNKAASAPSVMTISPDNIKEMYMLILRQHSQGEFWKTLDGGETWESISKIITTDDIWRTTPQTSLLIDPDNTKTMYFTAPNVAVMEIGVLTHMSNEEEFTGMYRTTDGGYTWHKHGTGFPKGIAPYNLAFDLKSSKIIYAGLTVGVNAEIKNNNFNYGLTSWDIVGKNQNDSSVSTSNIFGQVCVSIKGADIGIEQKVDNLKSGTKYYLSAMAKSELGDGIKIYVKNSNGDIIGSNYYNDTDLDTTGVIFTTDENETSVTIGAYKEKGGSSVSLASFNMRATGGLFRSYDSGNTFAKVDSFPEEVTQVNKITIDENTGKIYVSCGDDTSEAKRGGLWVSSDNMETWTKLFEMPKVTATTVDRKNPNRIITMARRNESRFEFENVGLYLSEDAGATWRKINKGLGNASKVYDVAFDGKDQNTLWATSVAGGFYYGKIIE